MKLGCYRALWDKNEARARQIRWLKTGDFIVFASPGRPSKYTSNPSWPNVTLVVLEDATVGWVGFEKIDGIGTIR
jgi:hypothetical protein